jgi:hypothetical protein
MSVRFAFVAAAAVVAIATLPSASEANWGHHRHYRAAVVAAPVATGCGCFWTRMFHGW